MQRDIFRKTDAGHAEIRGRALGLDALPQVRDTLSVFLGHKGADLMAQRIAQGR